MKHAHVVITALLAWSAPAFGRAKDRPRIAVIGSGIGGSSAAFFLRQELGVQAVIDVYEAEPQAGGRLLEFTYLNSTYEAGGSIIYSGNRYMSDLATSMGLTKVEPPKTLWRYGMSLFWLKRTVAKALDKFLTIYALQNEGFTFATPAELWSKIGLNDYVNMTIADHLWSAVGEHTLLERELVYAVNRVNYNQDNDLNALAGLISLVTLVGGDLFKIKEGNAKVAQKLLGVAGARLHFEVTVTGVASTDTQQYKLLAGNESLGEYDAVLIAAPLELAGIAFNIDGATDPPAPQHPFQTTHATFVRGRLRSEYFSVEEGKGMPQTVLLTEDGQGEVFSSIALYERLEDGDGVYKLFSRKPLHTGLLDGLFGAGAWRTLFHRRWSAYPKLQPQHSAAAPPVILYAGHGIFYVNALEATVSAMEVLVIAARNAALLARQWLAADADGADASAAAPSLATEASSSSGGSSGSGSGGGGAVPSLDVQRAPPGGGSDTGADVVMGAADVLVEL
ncbi:Prenylcysteine lyase-domain-containing protein [Tribonema minus]|uniref:Prenylcysteine lyase-domain-containing protein n=1 Tax=Tribonema minus TaxID=303371 RepID=A0A836C9V6_9STRA|nr:Prenylcysteine lyase-domain-containing protein [Tribonema minus]